MFTFNAPKYKAHRTFVKYLKYPTRQFKNNGDTLRLSRGVERDYRKYCVKRDAKRDIVTRNTSMAEMGKM
jgi:hypothetical protein